MTNIWGKKNKAPAVHPLNEQALAQKLREHAAAGDCNVCAAHVQSQECVLYAPASEAGQKRCKSLASKTVSGYIEHLQRHRFLQFWDSKALLHCNFFQFLLLPSIRGHTIGIRRWRAGFRADVKDRVRTVLDAFHYLLLPDEF